MNSQAASLVILGCKVIIIFRTLQAVNFNPCYQLALVPAVARTMGLRYASSPATQRGAEPSDKISGRVRRAAFRGLMGARLLLLAACSTVRPWHLFCLLARRFTRQYSLIPIVLKHVSLRYLLSLLNRRAAYVCVAWPASCISPLMFTSARVKKSNVTATAPIHLEFANRRCC